MTLAQSCHVTPLPPAPDIQLQDGAHFMNSSIRILAGLLASASFATIAHAGDIAGSVNDATGARPLQAASVRIVELDRSTQTDRDGHFIFGDVPAGTYTLEASYVGAKPETRTVAVSATGTVDGSFALAGIGGVDILVVGQAANQASALSREKQADGVVSVLTRDAIGQFPDQNVAESLRRLPGVNILNDQGEGRYVSVRGLDPELNSTSINGVRLPSPESDVRSVALDVISSDTIESIEVKKSFTPDMDGDFIGASVEIKTTSAFDRKKDYYAIRAEGSWNDYSGKVTPKGSLDFSKRLGDNFGIAGSVSYYKRKFETDNVEADQWLTDANGNAWTPTVEYRDYDVTRTRINAALSADWRVSDTTKAYIRGNWSQFDDHEYRRRTTFDFGDFEDNGPSASSSSDVSFDSADEAITVKRDLKDRFERQRIRTVAIGSDTDTGTWKFNWQASYAKSTELETFSVDPTRFQAKFDGKSGVVVDMDTAHTYYPIYALTSGADAVNDPTRYTHNRTEITTLSDSQDEEWAAKADLARTFSGDSGDFTIQAGAKARWRKKSYDYEMTYYGKIKSYTLADVLGTQTYRLLDMGPVASKGGPADYFLSNPDLFTADPYESGVPSVSDDYAVREDIMAGYLLGRWDSDTLRVIAGVRMEHTHNKLTGNSVTDTGDTFSYEPVRYTRNYTDWLPSITVRWSPQGNVVARLAGSRTIVRPKLSDMAPRYTINEDEEASFGNPYLNPYRSWNLDAGVSYYFSHNGALSFDGFYKSVTDYVVTQHLYTPGTFLGVDYTQASIPTNGGSAEILGFEASLSQAYTMLPAPFDGLLTQINYTYTYARGDVLDSQNVVRRISMPDSARNTFNVVLGYEKGPVSLRAAGTYRDKYLDELGDSASTDRFVQHHFQLDLSAKYKLTENIRLFADWVNVNNAKYFAYQNLNNARRLLQFEEYGSTVKFGARVTF